MNRLFIMLSFLVISMRLQAATFELITTAEEPLYQTTLPKTVYTYSRSPYLSDLSIMNASGEPIPYSIVPYNDIHTQTKVTEQQSLTIFPMREDMVNQPGVTNIQLNKLDSNTSLNVSSQSTTSFTKTFYLFDLGKKQSSFSKMILDWDGQEDKVLTVDILTSQNLSKWSHVAETTLLKVQSNDQSIIQNTVIFDHDIKAQYVKIIPKEPDDSFQLTSVKLEFNQVKPLSLPIYWQAITYKNREQNNSGAYIDFESQSRYPATYLNINLPEQNTITNVSILTKMRNDQTWTIIKNTSLYRYKKNGKEYTNNPIKIPNTAARYWRLSFSKNKGGIGKQTPQLSLGWLPDTLIWNARGSGPYTLEIGKSKPISNKVSVANLVKAKKPNALRQLPTASIKLLTSDQPNNSWESQKDYTKLWLWAGLLLGVIALASMVYSLLNNHQKTQSHD